VGAHALPILVDVKENADEKSLDNMVLAFGGGVDGTYVTADTGPCNGKGDSFKLKDNGNNTTTVSEFCSDVDTDPSQDVERVIVRNAANNIVAVIRITSEPEGVPEPSGLPLFGAGLVGLATIGIFGRRHFVSRRLTV
jgi:hypothetical protein